MASRGAELHRQGPPPGLSGVRITADQRRGRATNGVLEMIDESAADSENARQGFFRGPTFLHPDLQFQYRFPEGWSTWNERGAVIGLSSVQDAIIRLRVRAGTPPEAAATFFAQPELAADGISGTAINGLPATTGEFVAENGQGTVRGFAAFIACGAVTCEVVASAIGDAFDSYASEFRRSIATFDRLNGPGLQAAPLGGDSPRVVRTPPPVVPRVRRVARTRPSGLVPVPPVGSIGTAPTRR